MNITVEDATTQMLERLYEIEKQSFNEEAFSKLQLAYLLEDGSGLNLVACVGGEIVGFVMGRIELTSLGAVGHVMTIDVALDFRRKGVGTRLMLEIESRFKQDGAEESRLEVREGNVAARGLYMKLGYNEVALLRGYYGRAHGLCLHKALGKTTLKFNHESHGKFHRANT